MSAPLKFYGKDAEGCALFLSHLNRPRHEFKTRALLEDRARRINNLREFKAGRRY